MRQQLFCNGSFAQVMFELTNALLELGVPIIPQDEHLPFGKGYVHREEELFRNGSPDKYRRLKQNMNMPYNPETAITIYFTLFKTGLPFSRYGIFPNLSGRQVLYTTGNHTITRKALRRLADYFEKIIAPTWHVLQPYLNAGLSRQMGVVIPHGIDPLIYNPMSPPYSYPTHKTYIFLQNSFPWICEKGFDLTLQAFGKAFSKSDDVVLVLRTPKVENQRERNDTYIQLEKLVAEQKSRMDAPEILLLEKDMELNQRGGLYTGVDCYVHPLRAEGFGITILEAMACGLPVIATPWSGPADFLSPTYAYTLHHSNPIPEKAKDSSIQRYHVEPDLDHLIHLMRHVYEHRDESKRIGHNASIVARRNWTWHRAAAKLVSVLSLPGANTA
jgi:glycosyltransferase involved in cell wall biosynthesis